MNCVPCSVGMAWPPDRKYCRHGLAILVINLKLDKLRPAAVKEIPIILISLAWSKITSGVPKDPKRKMCQFFTEAVGRLMMIFIFVKQVVALQGSMDFLTTQQTKTGLQQEDSPDHANWVGSLVEAVCQQQYLQIHKPPQFTDNPETDKLCQFHLRIPDTQKQKKLTNSGHSDLSKSFQSNAPQIEKVQ